MTLFMLILYCVKVLPEAFKLTKEVAKMPPTGSGPKGPEICAGGWIL